MEIRERCKGGEKKDCGWEVERVMVDRNVDNEEEVICGYMCTVW